MTNKNKKSVKMENKTEAQGKTEIIFVVGKQGNHLLDWFVGTVSLIEKQEKYQEFCRGRVVKCVDEVIQIPPKLRYNILDRIWKNKKGKPYIFSRYESALFEISESEIEKIKVEVKKTIQVEEEKKRMKEEKNRNRVETGTYMDWSFGDAEAEGCEPDMLVVR